MDISTHLAWPQIARSFFITTLAVVFFAFVARIAFDIPIRNRTPESQTGTAAAAVPSPFNYLFNMPGVLHESATSDQSSSPYWWLDSGGKLLVEDGVGKTLQGALPASDAWHARYAHSSAADTDGGAHPQNLFRLLSRSTWDNVRIEASFRITADNFSESENRNESNGLLLMSRYQDDGATTYYAGLRVDGHAVIKKKYNGAYYTMAEKKIFDGAYDRDKNTNLLPHDEWLPLRSDTKTENGIVTITLSRQNDNGSWDQVLVATDDGKKYAGTPIIKGPAPIGIRTDFMDVEFDNFMAEKI